MSCNSLSLVNTEPPSIVERWWPTKKDVVEANPKFPSFLPFKTDPKDSQLSSNNIILFKEQYVSILSKSEEPELFSVKATQKTNEGKVTYANSITLTPGTVTTQIKDNVFEVHALTKEFGDDVRSSEMDRMVTWLEKGK